MSIRVSAPTQGLVLLAPALLIYCVFAVYPMLDVAALSFMKWNGLSPNKQFVGLANYVQVLAASNKVPQDQRLCALEARQMAGGKCRSLRQIPCGVDALALALNGESVVCL